MPRKIVGNHKWEKTTGGVICKYCGLNVPNALVPAIKSDHICFRTHNWQLAIKRLMKIVEDKTRIILFTTTQVESWQTALIGPVVYELADKRGFSLPAVFYLEYNGWWQVWEKDHVSNSDGAYVARNSPNNASVVNIEIGK